MILFLRADFDSLQIMVTMDPILDEAFESLANPERRRILLALVEHNPQTDQHWGYPDDILFERVE